MNTFELLNTKHGHVIKVDKEDADGVLNGRSIHVAKSGGSYAKVSIKINGAWKSCLVHRLIMGAKDGQIVDHINGDRLDNRRANLRFVTTKQNGSNKSPRGSIPYLGVTKAGTKFKATISEGGATNFLGLYESMESAAAAYNAAARVRFGEFARLNMVHETGTELESIIAGKQEQIDRLNREISALRGGEK